jgi:hypothetical protein
VAGGGAIDPGSGRGSSESLGFGGGRARAHRGGWRRRSRPGRIARAVAALSPFKRKQALVQVLDEPIEPLLERALPELQLLDPSGQPAQLFLQLGETHLEPGQAPRVLGLDQLDRACLVETGAHAVQGRDGSRNRSLRRRRGEPEKTGHARHQGPEPLRAHPSRDPGLRRQPVTATTVTARRFMAQARSSWPGSAGRSAP